MLYSFPRFEGRVVAKLPFVPIGFFQGLSHRGLSGDDYTDCSFIFLYILCTMSIRQVSDVIAASLFARNTFEFSRIFKNSSVSLRRAHRPSKLEDSSNLRNQPSDRLIVDFSSVHSNRLNFVEIRLFIAAKIQIAILVHHSF